jgi:hypothetical protein
LKNPPRRSLPYIPGIISALCLPLLFLVYAYTRVEPGYEYALPVFWFNLHMVEKYPEAFPPGIFPERNATSSGKACLSLYTSVLAREKP